MFVSANPEDLDLLGHLREHEADPEKKPIFNEKYSDILLVFDLDPQDPRFSAEKILEMSEFFVESTEMGKLYLNYPMVEAFYHMKSIPDTDYNSYVATLAELEAKSYKSRVNAENRNRDYEKFAVTKPECDIVIRQNMEKAWLVAEMTNPTGDIESIIPKTTDILKKQLEKIQNEKVVAVLCTCALYIVDYDPKLVIAD